jgi:propanol-preferring alcohol dehydrogenase
MGLPAGAYLKAPVFESVLKMITIKGSYVGYASYLSSIWSSFRGTEHP